MKRLLVLSYFYPPLAGGGVHRVLSFTRYLPAHGDRAEAMLALVTDAVTHAPIADAIVTTERGVVRSDAQGRFEAAVESKLNGVAGLEWCPMPAQPGNDHDEVPRAIAAGSRAPSAAMAGKSSTAKSAIDSTVPTTGSNFPRRRLNFASGGTALMIAARLGFALMVASPFCK